MMNNGIMFLLSLFRLFLPKTSNIKCRSLHSIFCSENNWVLSVTADTILALNRIPEFGYESKV